MRVILESLWVVRRTRSSLCGRFACIHTFFLHWKKEVEILSRVTVIGWKQWDYAAFLFALFRFISPPFALTCTILSNKDWKAFFFSVIMSPPSGGAQGW